jgi:hypothetical protein
MRHECKTKATTGQVRTAQPSQHDCLGRFFYMPEKLSANVARYSKLPLLTRILTQAARNMSGHIQRAETEVAGCVKLHRLASAFEHRGEKVDWDFIRRSVLRTRPPYADNLPGLIAFVAARSGGVDGPHLKYLQKWHGLTVTSSLRKQLPQGLYLTLSDFPFHYVALAIWQTAYTCPQEYLAFGLCKWISASDVGNLIRASNSPEQHAQVQLAEQALAYLRAKVPVAGFGPLHEESKLVTVFGKTDVAMGRMLLKRQAQSKVKHFSVADVLDYFVKEFTAVFPSKPTSAFVEGLPGYRTETPADPVASSSSEASGGLGLVRVSEEGVVLSGLALLRQRGLDVGTVLTQGTSGTHFRIERVLDATDSSTPESPRVVLQGLGDSKFERRSELVASVLADWRVASAKEVVETQSSWPAQRLCDLTDFKVLRFKGMILASLGALAELLDEKFRVHEAVVIYSKPARKVRAAQDFDKGALVLLPESANVKIAEQPGLRGVPPCGFDAQGAVHVCLEKTDTKDAGHLVLPGYNVTLAPATSDKALAPLWFVTTTPHADKANMTWEWFTIQELIGADHEGSGLLALPPAKRKRAHAKVSPELHDGVLQYNVKFPCLINAVALKEGDELICYKEAPIAKTKQGGAAITVAKLAKAAFEGPARK